LASRRTNASKGCRFNHSRMVSMFMETIVDAAAMVSNYVPKPGRRPSNLTWWAGAA
jgi:hypothetical protein